jgi:6-phospho-3-hexuloisomerase
VCRPPGVILTATTAFAGVPEPRLPAGGEDCRAAAQLVLAENSRIIEQVEPGAVTRLIGEIDRARRIFFAGEGRSGLVARMAAMRFMHLGRQVHVVGETTTPAMSSEDALVALSGSGSTGSVLVLAEAARRIGGTIIAVTAKPDSPLAESAEVVVYLPAAAKTDLGESWASRQFAGSLFEQAALVLLDSVFHALTTGHVDHESLWRKHTNLE